MHAQFGNSSVTNIAGGVHASAEPQQTLSAGFDYVAIGEGEKTIVDIAKLVIAQNSIENAAGLAWLRDEQFHSSGPAHRIKLDDYPPFAVIHRRFNPLEITRGCIYACKFCQTPFMFKARFRHRSVENVVFYVTAMKDLGLKDIRFITPTSLSYGSVNESVDLDSVENLLGSVRSVIGNDGRIFFGTFPSEVRPEHVSPRALEILKKYVDNDNIIIGAQSGSDKILKLSKRGHDVSVIEQAVRYTVEAGFVPNVDFIFGLPGETEADAFQSLRFADRLSTLGARIHAHTFMPLPGTPFKNESPGRVSAKVEKSISRLTARGKLYGKWKQQVTVAQQMAQQQSAALEKRNQSKRRLPSAKGTA